MKKYLVNYATPEFYSDQEKFSKSAIEQYTIIDGKKFFFIDKVFQYKDTDIKQTDFYKKHKETLDNPKGGGLWLWKPWAILEAMKQIDDGDLLIYADASAKMINTPNPLIPICHEQGGILLFTNSLNNVFYTKRDCLIAMDCDKSKYWHGLQAMGGFQVYIKNEKSMKFIEDLLKYCEIPNILTDKIDDGVLGDYGLPEHSQKGFVAGRNDQSVLSTLAIKNNIKLFRDPSQNGNHLKPLKFRKKWEWLNHPYIYFDGVFDHLMRDSADSKYPTIWYNYRGRSKIYQFFLNINNILPKPIKLFNKTIWDAYKRNSPDI